MDGFQRNSNEGFVPDPAPVAVETPPVYSEVCAVAEEQGTLSTGQPKITGYRNLSDEEIALMNAIKEHGNRVGELVEALAKNKTGYDQRWVNIGKTHLQQGFMALSRAVAKPTSF